MKHRELGKQCGEEIRGNAGQPDCYDSIGIYQSNENRTPDSESVITKLYIVRKVDQQWQNARWRTPSVLRVGFRKRFARSGLQTAFETCVCKFRQSIPKGEPPANVRTRSNEA